MTRKQKQYMRRTYPSKKKQASREAQRSGANAENLVEQVATHYEARLLARVRKRYEPYKRVGGAGRNGMFKAVNIGSSGPDFEVWLSDGRAGLMEVKSRKGKRIPLSAVGDAQACDLTRMSYWGHLSLVLVRLENRWYLVDYRAWTHVSKRSLNACDLKEQGVEVGLTEYGAPDFINAIDDAIEAADRYLDATREDT